MINDIQKMNKVILHFNLKYNGNWEKIYEAIKTKESVSLEEIQSLAKKTEDLSYLTIIDENYPENFKTIYMPPLCMFLKGNKDLMYESDKIISIWSSPNHSRFIEKKLPKDNIYAFLVDILDNETINEINKLLNDKYKLILISNKVSLSEFDKFKENKNLLISSEISPYTKKPNIDVEQTEERLLLGVSKHSLVLEKKLETFNYLWPLFKFEKRNFEVIDLSDFTEKEIERYKIIKFNQNHIIN